MYSKNRSRISVIILACRHIGIGLSVNPPFSSSPLQKFNGGLDAPNFYESSFWKDFDPKSGLGGWGDPNADYRVPDGGFHTLPLSYPSPHTVRRNFTLVLPPAPGASSPSPGPGTDNSASISASVIEAILNISPGDYKQFQTVVEVPGVRTWMYITVGRVFSSWC
jgi:tyrosinase